MIYEIKTSYIYKLFFNAELFLELNKKMVVGCDSN